MIARDRIFTVDDVWKLAQEPDNDAERFYLIDGELFVTMSPGELHGMLASEIARLMGNYVTEHDLGRVTVETGYHPYGNRKTLLLPDVAFRSKRRLPGPVQLGFVPQMPDLALEIVSPSNSLPELRRKALVYLRNGTALVWLLNPIARTAEVWRSADDDELRSEVIEAAGTLRGESVLPGFSLDLATLFDLD